MLSSCWCCCWLSSSRQGRLLLDVSNSLHHLFLTLDSNNDWTSLRGQVVGNILYLLCFPNSYCFSCFFLFHLQRNELSQKPFRFILVHIELFLASTKKAWYFCIRLSRCLAYPRNRMVKVHAQLRDLSYIRIPNLQSPNFR